MPHPSDLIALIKNKSSESLKEKITQQWNLAFKTAVELYIYKDVSFDDPITMAALERIGWRSLCQIEEKNIDWIKAEFEKNYLFFHAKPPETVLNFFAGDFHQGEEPRRIYFENFSNYHRECLKQSKTIKISHASLEIHKDA